ncbi:unnamed protein product [Rhizoctonia solani]|uniref:Ricin B lectin domain-containing protein n=1 Tax=Rhizoctonia solani TaxID=456999 RepID=A0A8H3DNM8_9AGAM|nr:unnamed protein product [Rhizoctonia solani]
MSIQPGTYVITNMASATNVALPTYSDVVRTAQGWQQDSSYPTQQWVVNTTGSIPGSYTLQCMDYGMYLQAESLGANKTLIGSNVPAYWRLEKQVDNSYQIVYPGSYYVAELANGSGTNATPIQLAKKDTSNSVPTGKQRWNFVKLT